MKKLLFAIFAGFIGLSAIATDTVSDGKVATTVGFVTEQMAPLQDNFPGQSGTKAVTFGTESGENIPRTVTDNMGSSTSDNSLPTAGAAKTALDAKQDTIPANDSNSVLTYTGVAGNVGSKGVYQDSGTYAEQMDDLVTAETFNSALANGLNNEFICAEYDPAEPDKCWLWEIRALSSNDSGYTELEYIKSSGTQKIEIPVSGFDTGNWSVYAQWMVTGSSTKSNPCIFCSSIEDSSSQRYSLVLHTNYTHIYQVIRGGESSNCVANYSNKSINKIHYATIMQLSSSFDGSTPSKCAIIGTRIPNTTFTVFDGVQGWLYAMKIQKDSVTQYDLVPVRRNSDGAIGMLDKVTNTFFGNLGTGAFTAGEPAGINTILPNGYTPVEYLQSSSTQYIDTGITQSTRAVIDMQAPHISTERVAFMYAPINASSWENGFGVYRDQITGATVFDSAIRRTYDITYDNTSLTMSADGINRTTSSYHFPNNSQIALFGTTSAARRITGKLYLAKIYNGDTLVAHFIPARRNSDNALGLYDIVRDTFLTNAGTGTFTAGPEQANNIYMPQNQ